MSASLRTEHSEADRKRIKARVHPLAASLPVLDVEGSFDVFGRGHFPIRTTRLGVSTYWLEQPERFPDPLLNLYSWSSSDGLIVEGRTFTPGSSGLWHDRKRLSQGGKPWKVTVVAVATEHVDRVLHLLPALMVRLYNGSLWLALPSEVVL